MYRYFKTSSNTCYISSWKSKGLYDEVIKPPTRSKCFTPSLNYMGIKTRLKFDRSFLKQGKIKFTQGTTVNIYIIYEIRASTRGYDDYTTLQNCLFDANRLIKNADIDKYKFLDMVLDLIEK